MDLREGVLDGLRGIADCDVWHQVEIERNAGELIQMIYSLRADNLLGRCYDTHRQESGHVTCGRGYCSPTRTARAEIAAGIASDVEIVQVVRVRPRFAFDFENDLEFFGAEVMPLMCQAGLRN